MPLSKAEHLIKTFKETVKSGAERGDIDGITNKNLKILQKYLRAAIHIASRTSQESLHFQSANPPIEPTAAGDLNNQEVPRAEWATDTRITMPAQADMYNYSQLFNEGNIQSLQERKTSPWPLANAIFQ